MNERLPTDIPALPALDVTAPSDAASDLFKADAALAQEPNDPRWMLRRLRALTALRQRDAALAQAHAMMVASDLAAPALDAILTACLGFGDAKTARDAIAQVEREGRLPTWVIARAKAQLAIASADVEAATAILVAAIEVDPDNAPLRANLTEALMAAGNAGHARAVLARLGLPPSLPDTKNDEADHG